jgi:hypothetical protein
MATSAARVLPRNTAHRPTADTLAHSSRPRRITAVHLDRRSELRRTPIRLRRVPRNLRHPTAALRQAGKPGLRAHRSLRRRTAALRRVGKGLRPPLTPILRARRSQRRPTAVPRRAGRREPRPQVTARLRTRRSRRPARPQDIAALRRLPERPLRQHITAHRQVALAALPALREYRSRRHRLPRAGPLAETPARRIIPSAAVAE